VQIKHKQVGYSDLKTALQLLLYSSLAAPCCNSRLNDKKVWWPLICRTSWTLI